MPEYRNNKIVSITFFLFLFCVPYTFAQTFNIKGSVVDATTGFVLPNASIYNTATKHIITTDTSGHFTYAATKKSMLTVQMVGYKKATVTIITAGDTTIKIALTAIQNQLDSVVISAKGQKYANKNPTVELIRKVIEHKPENQVNHYSTAEYEKYAKLTMYIDRFPKWAGNNALMRKYSFVTNTRDTTLIEGKSLMPVYIEETVSENYSRKHPAATNAIVIAEKKVDYGEFIDTKGMGLLFNRLFEDINIYDNNIVAFTKQFISPIADAGPTWYKYYIDDTITENGQKRVQLTFSPRNKTNLLFSGTMEITLDGRYAVKKIVLRTNKNVNLGIVRNFTVKQTFELDSLKNYHLGYSNVVTDFGLLQKLTGVIGERTVTINHFKTGMPIDDQKFKINDDPLIRKQQDKPNSYWNEYRPTPLSVSETITYNNIDSLNHMHSYKVLMDWVNTFSSGYKTYGKFQLGPVFSFLDYNPVEGFKPRIGGRTTSKFNSRYYFEGEMAYGFKDKQIKHYARLSYSLNNKSVYGYPKQYISISSKYETKLPGGSDDGINSNLLLALQKGEDDRYLYNRIYQANYLKETDNHWSYGFGLKLKNQRPAGDLYFEKVAVDGDDSLLSSIQTTSITSFIRWAPHEQFYQNGGTNRITVPNRYPVFTLTNDKGIKGFLGGDYNYDLVQLNIAKQVYLSALGKMEVQFNAGYLFGSVPWPLLIIHAGNQGYGIQAGAFNMMNYLEFMSDHYVSLDITHHFNGFIFNRIPLFKKLKWREIVGGKILYGGMRNENIPEKNSALLKYPTSPSSGTYYLSSTPYVELSAGISNIFKILRLDVIKRVTYLDHPGIQVWSIKGMFNLEL